MRSRNAHLPFRPIAGGNVWLSEWKLTDPYWSRQYPVAGTL